MRLLGPGLMMAVSSGAAFAQASAQPPLRGQVDSATRPASISYECSAPRNGRLACSFTELEAWKPKLVRSGRSPLLGDLDEAQCLRAEETIDTIMAHRRSNVGADGNDDALSRALGVVHDCNKGGSAGRQAYLAASDDKLERNCGVVTHSFKQSFAQVPGKELIWSTDSKPVGDCGIVRRSTFVGSRHSPNTLVWEYRVELQISNKSAQAGPLRCAEIREHDETYSAARGQNHSLECETVRFGPMCSLDDFPCLSGPMITIE